MQFSPGSLCGFVSLYKGVDGAFVVRQCNCLTVLREHLIKGYVLTVTSTLTVAGATCGHKAD